MARIRSVKPEFWTEAQIMAVPRDARLLLIGLANFADDRGVLPANAKAMKARIFPGDDDISQRYLRELLDQLGAQGLLGTFSADGHDFLVICNFTKPGAAVSQSIKNPAYRHPEPNNVRGFGQSFLIPPPALSIGSPPDRIGRDRSSVLRNTGPDGPDDQKPQNQPQDAPKALVAGEQPAEAQPPIAAKPSAAVAILLSKVVPPAGDWGKALFGPGLGWAAEHMGLSPTRVRPIIGRWLQTAGRSEGGQPHKLVFQTLAGAQLEDVADLRSWMPAALGGKREDPGEAPATVLSMIRRGDKSAYEKAVDAWLDGDRQGPRPRLEDFQEGAA